MNIRGKSLDSHVLISSLTSEDFAIAYLDFPRGPETELWLYSSLERGEATKNESKCEEQIIGVLKRAAEIEKKLFRSPPNSRSRANWKFA